MIIKTHNKYIDVFTSKEGWEEHTRFLFKNSKYIYISGKKLSSKEHKEFLNNVSNNYIQREQS